MPATIKIPTALRQFTNGQLQFETVSTTVGQALAQLTIEHNELTPHLYRNESELRNFINVYLNDEDIRHLQGLNSPIKDKDVISLVPSIAGGKKYPMLQ